MDRTVNWMYKNEGYGKIESKFMSLVPDWQDNLWFDCVLLRPIKPGKNVQPNFLKVCAHFIVHKLAMFLYIELNKLCLKNFFIFFICFFVELENY